MWTQRGKSLRDSVAQIKLKRLGGFRRKSFPNSGDSSPVEMVAYGLSKRKDFDSSKSVSSDEKTKLICPIGDAKVMILRTF